MRTSIHAGHWAVALVSSTGACLFCCSTKKVIKVCVWWAPKLTRRHRCFGGGRRADAVSRTWRAEENAGLGREVNKTTPGSRNKIEVVMVRKFWSHVAKPRYHRHRTSRMTLVFIDISKHKTKK